MGTLNISLTLDSEAGDLESIHLQDGKGAVQRLANAFSKLACGSSTGSVELESGTALAKASGTFTLDTVIATDAVSINGVTLTCVASGASNNEFNVGADDTETAANLAAAINASTSALVNEHVTATSAAAVVTVTAQEFGDEGDAITIASADATIVASGARLTGGEDATVTTFNFG